MLTHSSNTITPQRGQERGVTQANTHECARMARTHAHEHARTRLQTHSHTCMAAVTHVHGCIDTYTCTQTHTHTHAQTPNLHMQACIHTWPTHEGHTFLIQKKKEKKKIIAYPQNCLFFPCRISVICQGKQSNRPTFLLTSHIHQCTTFPSGGENTGKHRSPKP